MVYPQLIHAGCSQLLSPPSCAQKHPPRRLTLWFSLLSPVELPLHLISTATTLLRGERAQQLPAREREGERCITCIN